MQPRISSRFESVTPPLRGGVGGVSDALRVDTQGDPPPSDFWETETVMGLTDRFAALAMLVVLSLSTASGVQGIGTMTRKCATHF